MGSNTHRTYEWTHQVHANYEQFILQYVVFWGGSVFEWHPCELLYGEGTIHATQEGTGVLISVYILL